MRIGQLLKEIGSSVLIFVERLVEIHERRMEEPTPCQVCKEEHRYRDLLPRFSVYWNSPTNSQILAKRGHLPHSYCSACWEEICQKWEEEYRIAVLYKREAARVRCHNDRARQWGRAATLTVLEWIPTLNHFHWRCAYCIDGPYEHLEHRKPLSRGGGTTAENCIPSCSKCNHDKGTYLPEEIKESSRSPEAHRRIDAIMKELHGNAL